MLSEISQTEKNTVGFHLYMEFEKKKKTELIESENRLLVNRNKGGEEVK